MKYPFILVRDWDSVFMNKRKQSKDTNNVISEIIITSYY